MEMEKNKKNRYGFDFTPIGLDIKTFREAQKITREKLAETLIYLLIFLYFLRKHYKKYSIISKPPSNHTKMLQRLPYRRFFLWRTFRLSGIFRFWQIVFHPLDNPTFLFYLCNIQTADFQSRMFQHIILDFLISCLALRSRQIKLVYLKLHLDMLV